MYKLLSIAIFSIFLTAFAAFGQKEDVPRDEKAEQLVSLGKTYLRTGSYLDAVLTFDLAAQRPFNRLTTTARYYSALSHLHLGETEKAKKSFKALLAEFPQTSYREDIEYHLAMVKMESPGRNDKELGLDQMFDLLDDTRDKQLRKNIEATLRYFLFEVYEMDLVDLYYLFVEDQHKDMVMEAICYKLDQSNRGLDLLNRINTHEEKGHEISKYLQQLKDKYEKGKTLQVNEVNIAIFLSLHLELSDTARNVPDDSKRAFELSQGMKMALDSLTGNLNKRVNVKIYDTRGDTAFVRKQLADLEAFGPDIIIGEIRTSVNQMLGEWAEPRQVIQIVLKNPLTELIDNKRHVFLVHPTLENEATAMARFLLDSLRKRKILVFSTPTFFTKRYVDAFTEYIDSSDTGAMIMTKEVPKVFNEDNYKKLLPFLRGVKGSGYDAIYLPLSSEEWAGFIISELNYYKIETQIFGASHWEGFNAIDPELKSTYQLVFSSNYYSQNDSVSMDKFREQCLREYCYRPTENIITGYDVMAYILNALEDYRGGLPLVNYLHQLPPYKGLHQEIYFGEQQANQAVNILQYNNGKIFKLNVYHPETNHSEFEKSVPEGLRPNSGWR